MNNIQNKLFATQIKNFSAEIEQFAQDQLITHKTRDLMDTDFGTPSKLLTDDHFSITKICTADKAKKECWKTTATGKDKVTYKRLDGRNYVPSLGNLTVILKNGVMFICSKSSYSGYIVCRVDVNGNDKPNVAGRDFWGFYLDSKGHLTSFPSPSNKDISHNSRVNKCKNVTGEIAQYFCFDALVENGWKMDY